MNNIEKKSGLKVGHVIALLAILVLNVVWLACSTWTSIRVEGTISLHQIISILIFAATIFYAVVGYKKPHGNHMRYLILANVALEALQYVNPRNAYPSYVVIVLYAIIILKAFMAGRLDHYKQNVIISAVILAGEIFVYCVLLNIFVNSGIHLSFVRVIGVMGRVTTWLAIAAAYITRFKLHKLAGLQDKK